VSEVVVIGGGISGLSFAHAALAAGRRVTVVERAPTLGGCVHSERLGTGFWHELGAHTAYNSYGGLLEVLEARGLLAKVLAREKAPFRLLVGDEIRPVTKELGVLELLRSAPRLAFMKKQGRTVREYYGALVGPRNYDRVVGPLLAAVPSQRADDFPADMLFKPRPRRKDVRRSFTLEGGLSTIIDAIAASRDLTVRTGAAVTGLARVGEGFSVTLEGGERLEAPLVALAVPPPAAAALTRGVAPAASGALGRIAVAHVRSVGVVVKAAATKVQRFAGVIPLDGRFFSCVSRDTVPDTQFRGFALHAPAQLSKDQALGLAAGLLGLSPSAFEHVSEREVVLPSPIRSHLETVRAIDAGLAASRLAVTGNFFHGLSLEDCVQRSFDEAKRVIAR
jgi:protoporphyrinogen oxidase